MAWRVACAGGQSSLRIAARDGARGQAPQEQRPRGSAAASASVAAMCPIRVTSAGPVVPPSTTPRAPASPAPGPVVSPTVAAPTDAFVPATAADSVFPAGPRRWGSWAWDTSGVTTTAALDTLLGAHRSAGATELYLNAYPLAGRERFFKDALSRADAMGLKPQLLLGSPDWADVKTRPWLERSILEPLKTLRASVPTATVSRLPVHLDVEPHATGPLTPPKMRDYLETLSWFGQKLGPGFSLQVDIPSWYQGQTIDGKDFAQQILERVDGVTLMAYERTADQVLADVAPTLEQAARLGKQAMVAVEVGPKYASVGLGSQAEVRTFLARIDGALAGRPGYGGCAVHELDAVQLPPTP
jgi:hypothetical protein